MLNAWASVIGLTPSLVPDGVFGQKTLAAVRRAQALFRLPQAGEWDHRLWTGLRRRPVRRLPRGLAETGSRSHGSSMRIARTLRLA